MISVGILWLCQSWETTRLRLPVCTVATAKRSKEIQSIARNPRKGEEDDDDDIYLQLKWKESFVQVHVQYSVTWRQRTLQSVVSVVVRQTTVPVHADSVMLALQDVKAGQSRSHFKLLASFQTTIKINSCILYHPCPFILIPILMFRPISIDAPGVCAI